MYPKCDKRTRNRITLRDYGSRLKEKYFKQINDSSRLNEIRLYLGILKYITRKHISVKN